jgi:ribosomal-protein-alanine N-acetyltransferase
MSNDVRAPAPQELTVIDVQEAPEIATTERLQIVLLSRRLADTFARYQDRNRAHFKLSAPSVPEGADLITWADRVAAQSEREWVEDRSVRVLILAPDNSSQKAILGHIAFTQIARGPFQACYLGFGLDEREVGRGLMKEALEHAIRFMFDKKGLHRIMANYMPSNERSARTLKSLGFVAEGYARDYLFLDGSWRDHVLTSRTNPAFVSIK